MTRPRLKPYTALGIKRMKCFRCGGQAVHQWNICADNSATGKPQFRPMCLECDIALNHLVLAWSKFPNHRAMGKAYEKRARAAK